MITQEQLKQKLHYDPNTGVFTWISPPGRRADKVGKVAGNVNHAGYIRIGVGGGMYFAHRLAWLYMTGRHPDAFIDHKNMVKSDNRWCNLRSATQGENSVNRYAVAKSGLKGAYWSKQIKRWYSRCGGRYLGTFDSPEQAHEAYLQAAREQFGEFARPDITA